MEKTHLFLVSLPSNEGEVPAGSSSFCNKKNIFIMGKLALILCVNSKIQL